MRRAALLAVLVLAGGCATADTERGFLDSERPRAIAAEADTGSCRPFFVNPTRDWGEGAARHSCWNRLWEVPAALIVAPLAIALVTAPIWAPIILLR